MADQTFHVAMTPWLALGHLTAFLHMANKLAKRGHRVSFFVPKNTSSKLEHLNFHPHLIFFIPINVPHVDGLPSGSETTHDVPFSSQFLLLKAMDLTEPFFEASLRDLKPHFIFFDFQHWMPQLARRLKIIKALHFCTISPASVAYLLSPERKLLKEPACTETDYMVPSPSFPPSAIRVQLYASRMLAKMTVKEPENGVSFVERSVISFTHCDAIVFKASKEMEGPYIDYLERQSAKPIFLAGPVLPDPLPNPTLEERWVKWLGRFSARSMIFGAFGSECILKKDQFQELLLGLELTGMTFLTALKPPMGAKTIESALPEGFSERVQGRGVVYGGWVQQVLMLNHPSVGCFLSHCGSGSMTEALCSETQLVLIPNFGDQFINSKVMSGDLEVGVEVERGEEDGVFTGECACKAVKVVMDSHSELSQKIRNNHNKWRQLLSVTGLEDNLDEFVRKLHTLLILN
ncbi:cyanidin 3-O-galactoside 2''-O-xylosyltransferase FGGT1-like [Prosopis cineraria]|uniref:cyanidin 3-O-galactoside 2''-O-xylosyltransferase FGGT1-like n=1 Tax=Prosopis cineraria TaxID=364024 RepID=UPI00240F0FB1|nr:cyanidin 3-O-galactoside 2''-O-xylosyltransferase FGGT1-like [Prosopis cineraria]